MGTRKPIQIGNRSFPTQGEAIQYVSDRLNSYQPGTRVTPDDHALLMDLLQLHSDPASKIGSGIEYWTVEDNGPRNGGRHPGFYLHRHDGTEDDFGFSKVIKRDSPQNRVRGALANAIRDIMQQVRYEAFEYPTVFCARTRTIIKKREDAMVIHQEPAWGVLCDEFGSRSFVLVRTPSRAGKEPQFSSRPRDDGRHMWHECSRRRPATTSSVWSRPVPCQPITVVGRWLKDETAEIDVLGLGPRGPVLIGEYRWQAKPVTERDLTERSTGSRRDSQALAGLRRLRPSPRDGASRGCVLPRCG